MQKLIIFDCDGTLVESEVIATKVFTKYWASFGVIFSEDEFKEKFIGTGADAEIVTETFARMPAYVEAEGRKLLDAALLESLAPVQGVEKLLSILHTDICVASNSPLSHVNLVLKKTGLAQFCKNQVYSSEQVKSPKPAPDLFLHASTSLGYEPKDCLVVEDSPAGIKAAKQANMQVIAFSGASHFTPRLREKLEAVVPDFCFESTEELSAFLLESF